MYADPDTYLKTGATHIHRVVAEAVLGRKLIDGEVVHHIDFDRKNNNPNNLAVFPSQSDHARCHFGAMTDKELDLYRIVKTLEEK